MSVQTTSNPLISVCLPVCNGEAYLELAIKSVQEQTYGNFELLIADDCSNDRSSEIIDRYSKQDKRIVAWRNDKRLGLFQNYNACIERASGEFIKPFAQDDLWEPQLLAKQLAVLNNHEDVVLVAASRLHIDADGAIIEEELFNKITAVLGKKLVYPGNHVRRIALATPFDNPLGEPCAVMFRARARGEGFQTVFRHAGDLEYWLRILAEGDYAFIDEPLVYFRKHDKSTTASNIEQLWVITDLVHLAEQCRSLLTEIHCSPEYFIKKNLNIVCHWLPPSTKEKLNLGLYREGSAQHTQADVVALKQSLAFALTLLAAKELADVGPTFDYPADDGYEALANHWQIRYLEKSVSDLMRSPSWQYTRPLREFKRLIPKKGYKQQSKSVAPINSGLVVKRQRSYLEQLREQQKDILESKSWKFSAILRLGGTKHEEFVVIEDFTEKPTAVSKSPLPKPVTSHLVQKQTPHLRSKSSKVFTAQKAYDVIVGVHDGSRTGAPLLGLALAQNFVARGMKCLIVLKQGGELKKDFADCCDLLNLSDEIDKKAALERELLSMSESGQLSSDTLVFLNSAEHHDLVEAFSKRFLVVGLIHEFLSNYEWEWRSRMLWHSHLNVFSSSAIFNDALNCCETVGGPFHIVSQGLTQPEFGSIQRSDAREFLLREFGIKPESFVVIACGTADQRKGIDTFTQIAKEVLTNTTESQDIHFIWVGGKGDISYDSLWWAKRDVQKFGISKRVHFTGTQESVEPFFVGADVFLLTSRQDPMPSVVHLALAAALPIVAFKKSGGVEEVLAQGGGKLVSYGSIAEMAAAVFEYYDNEELRLADGATGRKLVTTEYRMDNYVDKLLELVKEHKSISKKSADFSISSNCKSNDG
jgi:glycosyltransferase involved in cell wall biosynthesis